MSNTSDSTDLTKHILQASIEAIEAIMEAKQDLHKIAEQIAGGLFTIGQGMNEVVIGIALGVDLAKDIYLGIDSRAIPAAPIDKEDIWNYETAVTYGIQRVRALQDDDR